MASCISKNLRSILTLSAIFAFMLIPQLGNAQLSVPGGGEIDLTLSTDSPAPGQTVTFTARSFNANINSATITWTVDGKVFKKGIGVTVVAIVTPQLGKASIVTVTAVTVAGKTISKSVTLRPSVVDMIIETDGYVPPTFPGKINPVFQNNIKVIAIPHIITSTGAEYAPENLVYTWKKDGLVLESQSGFGKQSITTKGDIIPRDYMLTVTVTPRTGGLKSEGSVSVRFGAPAIGFYTEDSLYGTLFNKAVTSTLRIGAQGESGVRAIPFGFNTDETNGNMPLTFTWSVNGAEQSGLASYQTLVLRAPEGGTGTSAINLAVKNIRDILQSADAALTVSYTQADTAAASSVTFP